MFEIWEIDNSMRLKTICVCNYTYKFEFNTDNVTLLKFLRERFPTQLKILVFVVAAEFILFTNNKNYFLNIFFYKSTFVLKINSNNFFINKKIFHFYTVEQN